MQSIMHDIQLGFNLYSCNYVSSIFVLFVDIEKLDNNLLDFKGNVMIEMLRRALHIPVLHIDANLINARQKLPAVNQLEKWAEDEIICINMSSIARKEARAGSNSTRTQKADQQIHTLTPPAEANNPDYKFVESIIFPGGAKNETQQNDIKIILEAKRYAAILITADGGSIKQPGGILGNRDQLKNMLEILSPDEAVEFVRSKIKERDNFNMRVAKEFGGELPEWTGKD